MRRQSVWEIIVGSLIVIIGLVALANSLGWTIISVGQVIGVIFALFLILIGFLLVRNAQRSRQVPANISRAFGDTYIGRDWWELRQLSIQSGVGDIRIDLSRVEIPEREGYIDVSGWIGDVEVLLPKTIGVKAHGSSWIGDMRILGHHQDGIARDVILTTSDFETAEKRVTIDVRWVIGDILVTRVE